MLEDDCGVKGKKKKLRKVELRDGAFSCLLTPLLLEGLESGPFLLDFRRGSDSSSQNFVEVAPTKSRTVHYSCANFRRNTPSYISRSAKQGIESDVFIVNVTCG